MRQGTGKSRKMAKSINDEKGQQAKSDISIEFGKRLREVRRILKISQRDFAIILDIAGSYLSEIESGKTRPGFDFFYKISKYFKINPVYLLHGEGTVFVEEKSSLYKDIDFGPLDQDVQKLIWYLERSPMVCFAILEYFTRYLHMHYPLIEEDMKKFKQGIQKS
jgi:transcriptional regulator with XRE-family HTH domain